MNEVRLLNIDFPDDPYSNIALDEVILDQVAEGKSPPTLRFYRNRNAVILGCFQLAEEEVDLEYASGNGIKIVKRITGGGAVYHDMGDQNFSFISKDGYGIGFNVTRLYSLMLDGAIAAFRSMGLEPESGKLNDVTVNGKKILGAAASIKANSFLFHAAVLVDTNIDTLASVLKVPGIKLKDKGISTIKERVTNVKVLSGKGVEEVRKAVADAYSRKFGFKLVEGDLTADESRLLKEYCERKFARPEWNMGREFIKL